MKCNSCANKVVTYGDKYCHKCYTKKVFWNKVFTVERMKREAYKTDFTMGLSKIGTVYQKVTR